MRSIWKNHHETFLFWYSYEHWINDGCGLYLFPKSSNFLDLGQVQICCRIADLCVLFATIWEQPNCFHCSLTLGYCLIRPWVIVCLLCYVEGVNTYWPVLLSSVSGKKEFGQLCHEHDNKNKKTSWWQIFEQILFYNWLIQDCNLTVKFSIICT